ncbi:unnamed protein product [Linum tenue]|nr:unnamed protein product [Linum tenue]
MIGEHYITVRPWRRNFNPKLAEVASTMVWAKLPDLPREFINREAVERIASRIGRPIRVNRSTQTGDRGRFARVSVEVDLTKPLLSQYKIEGITYYVEFEGLHNICTECRRYGHSKTTCPTLFKAPSREEVNQQPTTPVPALIYGEWMMAKPRKTNQKKKVSQGQGNESQPMREPSRKAVGEVNAGSGSQFQVLAAEATASALLDSSLTADMEVQVNLDEGTAVHPSEQPSHQIPLPISQAQSKSQPPSSHESHATPAVQRNSLKDKDSAALIDVPVQFAAEKKIIASPGSQPSGATVLTQHNGKQRGLVRSGQENHQKAKGTNTPEQLAQTKGRKADLPQGSDGQPPGQPTAQMQLKDKGAKGPTENGPPPAL